MKKQEYADIEARLAAAVSDLSDRTGTSMGADGNRQEKNNADREQANAADPDTAAGTAEYSIENGRTGNADLTELISAAEELWEQPVERAEGSEWYLEGTESYGTAKAAQVHKDEGVVQNKDEVNVQHAGHIGEAEHQTASRREKRIPIRRIWSTVAAAAAVLVFVMFYYINLRTDAVVFLDVNPSVSLEINSRDKVTQALACNADGEKILAEMDLRRTDVDVAVNALIGSMIRSGYLNEVQDTLLLSVDCTNAEKKEALRQRLSGAINEELLALLGRSAVFDQDVDVDDDLEDLAERYGITPGKAALILKLIEKDSSLDFEKLAGMPMNVLAEYLQHDAGIDLRDYARYIGDDWDDDEEDDWDDDDDRDDDDGYDDDDYDDDGGDQDDDDDD